MNEPEKSNRDPAARHPPAHRQGRSGWNVYPRWVWLLSGAIAVLAIVAFFVVGPREAVRTTDTLPQQIGLQIEEPPVVAPTPATPAPSPEPATPAKPPIPVE